MHALTDAGGAAGGRARFSYTRLLLSLTPPEGDDTGLNVPSPPGRPSPSAITRVYQESYAEAVRQRRLEQEQLRQRAQEQHLEGIRNGTIAPPPRPLSWFSTPAGEPHQCGRHRGCAGAAFARCTYSLGCCVQVRRCLECAALLHSKRAYSGARNALLLPSSAQPTTARPGRQQRQRRQQRRLQRRLAPLQQWAGHRLRPWRRHARQTSGTAALKTMPPAARASQHPPRLRPPLRRRRRRSCSQRQSGCPSRRTRTARAPWQHSSSLCSQSRSLMSSGRSCGRRLAAAAIQ